MSEPDVDADLDPPEWSSLEPDELTDLAPDEWPRLRPRVLRELERRGLDTREVPDEALPGDERCPRCGWPVFQMTAVGPGARIHGPCGCRVGGEDL
ncbi:hypothetical protein [Halovivax sp.]|uniref:hypothetical protein n=1 Tax=Halovivax sp. TaxID=1935978 RepID=UPI0025B9A4A6|nr:hypothetical protein [Halovivax sp.]